MNRLTLTPSYFYASLRPVVLAVACAVLSGCTWMTQSESVPVSPSYPEYTSNDPDSFLWETQVLEAVGVSSPPRSGGGLPQRIFALKQSARTAAIRNLQQQVQLLPVYDDVTVGTAMETVIAVRHGIEQTVKRADVVEEQQLEDGSYQVRVRTPLAPIAEALRQSYITPNTPLPERLSDEENLLGPMT